MNQDDVRISDFIKLISPYCKNFFEVKLQEEYLIETSAQEDKIGNNKIQLVNSDPETFRVIMLNVSQSVALDYYSDQATILMEETNHYTFNLERTGRLSISGNRLK